MMASEPLLSLTPRELGVLRLVFQGKTNQEIGLLLEIKHETVKAHIRTILLKLDVTSRTSAAVAYALWARAMDDSVPAPSQTY